ncbi:MAG TPA: hypothetical protein QGF40_07880 [Candidatus Marinimicrobia bacterium]|nr:hypothetical protein [Candidatus Neomarinimicrobiota bacterium]
MGCVDMGSERKMDDNPKASVSFSSDIQPVFDISCATSGCHRTGHFTNIDLSEGNSYINLVNVESINFAPLKLVDPGKPEDSVLYLKIVESSETGSKMPPGGTLSDASVTNIQTWITEGAENN